jgi:hypothetical protein
MAVSFVNSAKAGTNSITLPSGIQAGDIIVLFGFRNTTTAPTLPTGYTNISSQSANGISYRSAYKIATGSESGTSVTFTNANVIQCAVYRGASRVGNAASTTNASSANTSIAGIGTFVNTDGTSWAVLYGGSAQTTSMSTPSAVTLRGTTQTGTSCMALIGDSNTGVSTWGLRTSANGTNAAGGGGSVELIPIGAKVATLTDPFNQNTLGALWTQTTGGSATMAYSPTGATVTYPSSSTSSTLGQVQSASLFDLTSSSAFVQVLAVPSASTSADGELRLQLDSTNWVRFVYEAGTLYAQKMINGSRSTVTSAAYNATTHAWWRIEESGGTITFKVSSDGLTWSNFTGTPTTTVTFAYTALRVMILGSCFQAESSPGTFKWNNFNTAPATTGQVKTPSTPKPVKVLVSGVWVTKPIKRYNGSSWVPTNY